MTNAELLQTLSGCRFYRRHRPNEGDDPESPSPRSAAAQSPPDGGRAGPGGERIDRVFWGSCKVMGGVLAASTLVLVLPLWLVYPPYGKACLLSLPPMLFCALSWTVAARWARGRDVRLLMVVTIGATPVRMVIVLSWAWLVLKIPDVAKSAFVVGMMWHWAIFSILEFAMLLQLSPQRRFRLLGSPAGRPELVDAAAQQRPSDNMGTVPILAQRKWDCPPPKPESYSPAAPEAGEEAVEVPRERERPGAR